MTELTPDERTELEELRALRANLEIAATTETNVVEAVPVDAPPPFPQGTEKLHPDSYGE